ncbi:hypothetical protein RG963_15295 [Methanosarcina sp. Z-7115]|uniref:GTPases-Sulfate adenylate transferase subunit 1 n=1 Tax=Methanosarcina baikalica TaxID=3073890 RepID=A0ABU2D552_9EURY|nr:hypothetical protein [Methanosarcina sp. Z-7115]MDR7667114.1 hypothetical protein [Methanosarcina sp. Z-7115]
MRTNQKLMIGIFVLAILLVPLAVASEDINKATKDSKLSKSYTFTTNESTSKVLAQVYGTDITMAEFMDKVYPGSLNELPKDSVARLKKTPMTWPKPGVSRSGDAMINDIIATSPYYAVTDYSALSTSRSQGTATYSSIAQVTAPTSSTTIPEISITSYLFKDGDTSPMASATSYGFNTNKKTARGTANLVTGYHSYYTSGYLYVVWPIGCNPATGVDTTVSSYQYVTYP